MTFLLDSCVISELVAKRPNRAVVQWIDGIEEEKLYLSVITIGEIKKGIDKLANSARRDTLSAWLEDELLLRFRDKILPIDTAVMLVWGEMTAELETRGRPMSAIDSLIAATCLHGGLDLVTRNESDFTHSGVTVINPWKS